MTQMETETYSSDRCYWCGKLIGKTVINLKSLNLPDMERNFDSESHLKLFRAHAKHKGKVLELIPYYGRKNPVEGGNKMDENKENQTENKADDPKTEENATDALQDITDKKESQKEEKAEKKPKKEKKAKDPPIKIDITIEEIKTEVEKLPVATHTDSGGYVGVRAKFDDEKTSSVVAYFGMTKKGIAFLEKKPGDKNWKTSPNKMTTKAHATEYISHVKKLVETSIADHKKAVEAEAKKAKAKPKEKTEEKPTE